jgi:pimeloyl-ACP methyl ester carboxylesterase
MGDAHSWDLFSPIFASRYRVIATDARGHGESDWSPARQYSPEYQAVDLTQLLVALDYDEVSIVGASMGGWTGYNVAAQFPPLVKKLVVVDVSPEVPPWRERIVNRCASLEDALAARMVPSRGKNETLLRESVERNLMLMADGTFSWRYDVHGMREGFSSRDVDGQWRLLQEITASTLLVRGAESDILTPELAERVCRIIPDARLIEVPGAGHPVPRDQPALFLAAVAPFLLGA